LDFREALRTFALALFLAVLGFSYALATHSDRADARARAQVTVQPRQVDLPLRFTNAFLPAGADPAYPSGGAQAEPQGFDLGDACLNQPVTRFLTATGGYLPYSFEARANFDFVGTNETPPIPKVFRNGRVSDTFSTSIKGAARFNAIVSDFLGTQRTGTFRLNLFPSPSSFRFAQDALPTALLGNTYFTNLETLTPTGAVTFSLLGSVSAGGAAFTRLEDVGMTLTPDGLIFGRPAIKLTAPALTMTFTVRATDSVGHVALSRDGTHQDQTFVIPVEGNTITTSEILALHCKASATTKTSNHDSFSYFGAFDPKGLTVAELAGSDFTLRIGRAAFTGSFDDKGKVFTPFGGKRNGLKVTVSPVSATIAVSVTGADLAAALNTAALAGRATQNVVVLMEFKHYRACEPLTLTGRAAPGRVALQYNLGPHGHPMAGGFQVLNVLGSDRGFAPSATPGDIWVVRWLGVPRFGIDSGAAAALPVRDPKTSPQTGSVSATIRIGDGFSQTITATLVSHRMRFNATGKDPGLYKCTLDGEYFLHSLTSNILSPDDTEIPQAIGVKNATIFRFGMDVPNFKGQTGRVIIPNNFSWFEH
jgi:hypothetical protein